MEDGTSALEIRSLEITQLEANKQNKTSMKRVKKAYVVYSIPSKGQI